MTEPMPSHSDRHEPRRPPLPVLVVDDHDDTRHMVQTFLRAYGYAVSGARNGSEALTVVARELPCLILLDLMMPVMDGPTFARLLRQLPDLTLAATPIVLLTAVPNASVLQEEIGAIAVLRKPVSFDALAAVVAQHCGIAGTD